MNHGGRVFSDGEAVSPYRTDRSDRCTLWSFLVAWVPLIAFLFRCYFDCWAALVAKDAPWCPCDYASLGTGSLGRTPANVLACPLFVDGL